MRFSSGCCLRAAICYASAEGHGIHLKLRSSECFTLGRGRGREKSTKFSLVSIQPLPSTSPHFARSESIYTSFWKLISSSLSMVKTDFQTQSRKQSIFRWQCKSVGAGSLGYERRDISISLFNSLWHPAYVSLGTM